MSWLFTLIRRVAVAAAMLLAAAAAQAQSLEAAVMPGPVIQGHADLEATCERCHVRFDRAAQARLCLDCHKPVRADVAAGSGYHGRLKQHDCRTCHSEHKGRNARIVKLDEHRFDHRQTDFQLRGKHGKVACASCHKPGVRHRQAPVACDDCHRKDDRHRGGLGAKCESCHDEQSWKEARFDHAKTKFPLRLGHAAAKIKCNDCHADAKFAATPRACAACHRQDDVHKGRFGARCETCHDEDNWKAPSFRHDRDTQFALQDRHRAVKCDNCHRAPLYKEKTPTRCVACHRGDDDRKGHRGALGDACDKCHSARGWKGTSFDHDRDAQFPLRDKHRAAKCDACHKDLNPRDAGLREKLPRQCVACHEKDDRERGHRGNLGERCEKCHDAQAFKPAHFDHGRATPFALAGKHARAPCASCHRSPLYGTKTDSRCYACHEKEDVHFGSFDLKCDLCHVAADWRTLKDGAPVPRPPPPSPPPKPPQPQGLQGAPR